MAFSFRDNLRQKPNFATMGTEIPEYLRRTLPAWSQDPPINPSRDPDNPFGDPPRPTLELDPPERNPYNDPDYSPFIVTENLSAKAGYDPDSGLPALLQPVMRRDQAQLVGSLPNAGAEYNPGIHDSLQGGLLGRLLALQAEQGRYQPMRGDGGQRLFPSQNSNLTEFSHALQGSETPAEVSMLQMQAQYEADQAQQARDAAAMRIARGVRSRTRAEAEFSADPVDIAKSTGIGFVKGGINAASLPGDILTGFGSLPNNLVANGVRRMMGHPDLPSDAPDWIRDRFTAEPIQRAAERTFDEFYKPRSRAGRFAETIGEMAPMVLGGEGLAALLGKRAVISQLPGTLAKHTVAPGIAVQALEEALPDSKAGEALQKAYPVLRRGLPAALAAKRYLGRRVVPK
jgi:hypothetical protein